MSNALNDLKIGDIISTGEGSARLVRTIRPGPGTLTRIAFDDGTVWLVPATQQFEPAPYATRRKPRTHAVAIEIRGLTRHAYVYIRPGTPFYRDWFKSSQPATTFDHLADAQDWLVRVIGYEALETEIFYHI